MKVFCVILCVVFLTIVPVIESNVDHESLPYMGKKTFVPETDKLIKVLEDGLKLNFKEVTVEFVDSPDLSAAPYFLASSGLNGDPTVMEYGENSYLTPLVDKSKHYDLIQLVKLITSYKDKDFFTCGAGAGDFTLFNQNCEGMFNIKVHTNGTVVNKGSIAKTKKDSTLNEIEIVSLNSTDTKAALLGNIFISEGKPGKVIKVTCKQRIGEENFISAMRLALVKKYPKETIGIGGVFILKNGTANIHVMDDFSKTPINTDEELNSWLTWHNMTAPLIAVGTFTSSSLENFDLRRLEHFHMTSNHGQGGHYHYDTTPDTVEYEGYFVVAERIVRIDKSSSAYANHPKVTCLFSFLILLMFFHV
ncbi:unnamed protein product [Diamesa tonsa]